MHCLRLGPSVNTIEYVNTELHHGGCHAASHKTQHNYLGILPLPQTSVQIILRWKDRPILYPAK